MVEPREPYRVKAGIFELYNIFNAISELFMSLDTVYIAREIRPATQYIS